MAVVARALTPRHRSGGHHGHVRRTRVRAGGGPDPDVRPSSSSSPSATPQPPGVDAAGEQQRQQRQQQQRDEEETPQDVTKRWGLEAGLFKIFFGGGGASSSSSSSSSGSAPNSDASVAEDVARKGVQAKDLLRRYGVAYLITSIFLAAISFSTCYALVSSGVDVNTLLAKVGLKSSLTGATSERIGRVAIAYAAHKAASPFRFPPTVALTPLVAKLIGKKNRDDESDERESE